MSDAKVAVIWRSCLLPGSETFVRHQGDALPTWRAVYLGAIRVDSPLSRDTDVLLCPDTPRGRRDWLRLRLTGDLPRLHRLLARLRPDVVHAHFGGDGWLVSRAATRLGIPLVITLHGLDVTRQPTVRGWRGARHRRHLRTAFDRAALILAVSGPIRDRALELGADPAKVRVHHTGVPVPAEPPTGPKNWDVVFVGRFVDKKGVDDLVEALSLLADLRPRTLFIGTGPLLAPVRAQAERSGVDATFAGALPPDEVLRHVTGSRVLAAPSRTAADGDTEGLPTTILEAASLGVPVVSTYHSGIPEAVTHEVTGLLGPEADPPALAANLRRLLTDTPLRHRLGEAAHRRAATHFDLHRQTRTLEHLYATLSTPTPRPSPVDHGVAASDTRL
ncbi:glycosyltransferase [Micromonospora sp. NPDC049903]|uniref:glycosyltransferase n=1 Tax=Micromonospora sp. NPDC049903 TaxID=3364276 RepID=UPI00379055F5